MTPKIAPSILNFSHADLAAPISQMERAGAAWIHVDVMDGQFVPPITFGDGMVRSIRGFSSVPIEAHLMICDPDRQIEAFANAGCSRLIFHAEAVCHSHRVVQAIHAAGMEAGVAINPGTSLSAVEELENLVELILIMTVNPGYGGQEFLPEALHKVKALRARQPKLTIEVDGGIHEETIPEALKAGADLFVVGSYLKEAPSIGEAFARLAKACE